MNNLNLHNNIKTNSRIFFNPLQEIELKETNKELRLFIQESKNPKRLILKRGFKASILYINTYLINLKIQKIKDIFERKIFGVLKNISKKEYFKKRLNSFSSYNQRKKYNIFLKYIYPSLTKREFIFSNSKKFKDKINLYLKKKEINYQFNHQSINYFFKKLEEKDVLKSIKVFIKKENLKHGILIGKAYFINKLPFCENKEDQLPIKKYEVQFKEKIEAILKQQKIPEDEPQEIFIENKLISITNNIQENFFLRLKKSIESNTRYSFKSFRSYFNKFHLINENIPQINNKNIYSQIPVVLNGNLSKIFLFRKINSMQLSKKFNRNIKNFLHILLERKHIFQTYSWLAKKLKITKYKTKKIILKLKDLNIIDYEFIKGRGHFLKISNQAFSSLKKRLPKKIRIKKSLYNRFNFLKKKIKNLKLKVDKYFYKEYYKIGTKLGFFKLTYEKINI